MGQRMSAGLKKYAAAGIGAAFGAGLGMALTGANELDAATRQLQADAGLTAEEAKSASKALAGMYRDNLQGFDEIGRAMASVHNDLGLAGEAADKATAKFLKYATATGQDAADSVAAFDDMLDAWNLTAEDAAGLMDGLIADHQEFGGVIGDSQDALAAMAPAMQAANMEIEDGRALLNLFNAAGIDSSKAAAALNKAVKELKPGQSLNDLVARIGAIEDPTERAQEAMDIFGAKSGIGLAQAIKPGMTSLDDFAVSAADAAGATENAATAIEDGFGNRAKMALKGFQGTLAEVGTNFGDLIMVAAMLGPQLTRALGGALGGVAGMLGPKMLVIGRTAGLKLAAGIAGTAVFQALATNLTDMMGKVAGTLDAPSGKLGEILGSKLGKAASVAFAAVMVVEVWNTYNQVKDQLASQNDQISADVANQIKSGTEAQLAQSKAALEQGLVDINNVWDAGIFTTDTRKRLEGDLAAVNAELERRAAGMGPAVAEGALDGVPAVEAAAPQLYGPFITEADIAEAAVEKAGGDIPLALAAGITEKRNAPLDAFQTLREMLKNAMSPAAEVARLQGQLTSKALARGLKSSDPAVRAQAQGTAAAITSRLAELAVGGGKAGKRAMAKLNAAIRGDIPELRDAALKAKEAVVKQLEAAKGPAGAAGDSTGDAFSRRLRGAVGGSDFKINAGITFDIGGRAAGGPVRAGVPYWVNEDTPYSEVFVPSTSGQILTHDDAMAAAGRGGDTYNIPLTVQGALPVRTIRDIQREMERIGDLGIMPPRQLAPMYRRREAMSPA
jgi:Phage-related minor tail protein